tara:strand:- start:3772 stop:4398 length:627 start_codon:yes stop_codon:yes gene_type:complete
MLFKYPRVNGVPNSTQDTPQNSGPMPMNMRNIYGRKPRITRRPQDQEPNTIVVREPEPKTMLWGEPVWFLLHTLVEKVNESTFPHIRSSFIQFIIRICGNLPCPECANHATQYMQGINFQAITTKMQLKVLLWEFHNTVNRKKGFAIYPFEKMDIYERANVNNIVNNFIHHFEKKTYSMRLGTHNFHRGMAITNVRKWLSTNMKYFSV